MASVQLPKRVHYVLKGLCCLAQAERTLPAHEVARCTNMPPAQAAKILYLLTWGGFIVSERGSKGGFRLARTPEQIRVREVLKFFTPPGNQAASSTDSILKFWRETADGAYEALAKMTLAELMLRLKDKKKSSPYVCPDTGQVFVP